MTTLSQIENIFSEKKLSAGHEHVNIFQDKETGLVAIVAVHDTSIGPALGGCRMHDYPSLSDALVDVLRLSEAMSYKNALCGISFGGGKSVIYASRDLTEGREALFRSFGRCVQGLGGRYITAEDVGTRVSDMSEISKETKYVAGTDPDFGGGGDPSPHTALGVFEGLKSCLKVSKGSGDLSGVRVLVQGVGNVGHYLVSHLVEAGAEITVTDVREKVLSQIKEEFGLNVCRPEEAVSTKVDVFCPCAFGGVITEEVAANIPVQIIAGGANNQLASAKAGEILSSREVLYAPDFAINSGGVILCADEFEPGGFSASRVRERVLTIGETIEKILKLSKDQGVLPEEVALKLAKEQIERARQEKSKP